MARYSSAFLFAALILALPCAAAPQNSGSIEFSDGAPPPTDAQKANAKITADRAADLASKIQTLASAMKAVMLLRSAIGQASAAAPSSGLSTKISEQEELFSKAIVIDNSSGTRIWTVDPEKLKDFIRSTILLTSMVGQENSNGAGAITRAFADQLDSLSLIFDTMVAEHGILNRSLRYYPLVVLQKQSPVSCETINRYSRDFKCLPSATAVQPDTSTWLVSPPYSGNDYCQATNVQNFPVSDSRTYITLVRMNSLTDHLLPGELKDAAVPSPHSKSAIGAAC